MKKYRLKLIILVLIVTLLPASTALAWADEASGTDFLIEEEQQETGTKVETTVSGLNPDHNLKASSAITDVIKVQPFEERTVELQYFDEILCTWDTVAVFPVSAENGTAAIVFPDQWKTQTETFWRIYVPATETASPYLSSTIDVVARNIKSLDLKSKSAVIIRESDKKVIYGKNMNTKRHNASTTKMMTALLVLENDRMDGTVTYTKTARNTQYACLGVKSGTKFRVKDLLRSMMLLSSNDSATALAVYTGGSVSGFSEMMNERAQELGCRHTHFVNPHGLDRDNHYSTAYDLSLIQGEAIQNSTYRKVIGTSKYTFRALNNGRKSITAKTTDVLLKEDISGFIGGKTGFTFKGGNCFSGVYEYDGETYIFTVLGSSTSKGRWSDCRKLMKYIRTYNN